MDITLERVLSLIPRKPDGKYVHGAKAEFADRLGLSRNLVTMWESGQSQSYRSKLHEISAKYGVSVEWLKGETDEKRPFDLQLFSSDKEKLMASIDTMSKEELLDFIAKATEVLRGK